MKHAFIDRDKAKNRRGKIGVEHADFETIREALMHVSSPLSEAQETIDKTVLIELGLIIGPDARRRRDLLGRRLHIGHSNGKQLLKTQCLWLYRRRCKKGIRGRGVNLCMIKTLQHHREHVHY